MEDAISSWPDGHHEPPLDAVEVSVVIVSWNVADLLADCIRSILDEASDCGVEVIVVDNNSDDHTLSMLSSSFPWVRVVANRANVGFARANNQGFDLAQGRLVLFLNPDTILVKDALKRMVDFLHEHSRAGMVGPRLEYPDGTIQAACARPLPTLSASLFCEALRLCNIPLIGKWVQSSYDYDLSQEVEAISGAAMLVRPELIRQLGGFGEAFIHTGEDIELCFRFRKAGWKIHYLSDAVVIHFKGRSSQQAPIRTSVNGALSRQEYFYRCFGAAHGYLYRLIVQGIRNPVMLAIGIVKVLLGRESGRDFRLRWAIALAVWRWQEIRG